MSRRAAWLLGASLLVGGVIAGWTLSYLASDWRPGLLATALAACIVLYDAALKRTPVAPFFMGVCRSLNVLLGMSLAAESRWPLDLRAWNNAEWAIAIGVGVYVAGVTIFARTEAGQNRRHALAAGLIVQTAGLAILCSAPSWNAAQQLLQIQPQGWYLLWVVLALLMSQRCVMAIMRPTPRHVQAAVRHCLRSIIVIDAAVVLGFCGLYWGCAVLLLLVPMLLLEQWFNTT